MFDPQTEEFLAGLNDLRLSEVVEAIRERHGGGAGEFVHGLVDPLLRISWRTASQAEVGGCCAVAAWQMVDEEPAFRLWLQGGEWARGALIWEMDLLEEGDGGFPHDAPDPIASRVGRALVASIAKAPELEYPLLPAIDFVGDHARLATAERYLAAVRDAYKPRGRPPGFRRLADIVGYRRLLRQLLDALQEVEPDAVARHNRVWSPRFEQFVTDWRGLLHAVDPAHLHPRRSRFGRLVSDELRRSQFDRWRIGCEAERILVEAAPDEVFREHIDFLRKHHLGAPWRSGVERMERHRRWALAGEEDESWWPPE